MTIQTPLTSGKASCPCHGNSAPPPRRPTEAATAAPTDRYVAAPATPADTSAAAPSSQLAAMGGARAALSTAFSLLPANVTHVLYHANCPDGFGAAWAAWKRLGDKAEYIPVTYGQAPPQLPADARVAVVDFSYPREQLLDLKSKVADLVVLDHHESAEKNLVGLPFAYFDMKHSGARLSWDYFHPDEPVPDLVSYVEDRDIWNWRLPQSHEFSNGLSMHPMDFHEWDSLSRDIPKVLAEGTIVTRYRDLLMEKILQRTRTEEIDGHQIPLVDCPHEIASEVCNLNLERHPEAPFVASYYDDQNRNRNYELRSTGDFDVSVLASRFGGGGHKHAAAFRVPLERISLTAPAETPPGAA